MQHSAVDLENYARMYMEDRLRDSAQRQRADEAAAGASWLGRAKAQVQAWCAAGPREPVSHAPTASRRVELVPAPEKALPASADPYAGMIVLVRGPKEPCSLDAA